MVKINTIYLFMKINVLIIIHILFCRKNVADYSASREKNDLGYLTFDLQTDILFYYINIYLLHFWIFWFLIF